jgi:hypothetical protein
MDSHEYEQYVKGLVKKLSTKGSIASGLKNKWKGKSGFKHQIDVSVELPEIVHLIECKYWKCNISPEALLAFSSRVYDIRKACNKSVYGAMVTNLNYTNGVQKLAKFFGIHLDCATKNGFLLHVGNNIHWESEETTGTGEVGGDIRIRK